MYTHLINQLRSTVSKSKRTMFDDAADAIEQLQKELREERHRHDRLQDFEVAEAEQPHQMRIERDMLAEKLREKESVLELLKQGKQQWRDANEETPGAKYRDCQILVIASGLLGSMSFNNTWLFASFDPNEGWSVPGWEHATNLNVHYWLPLPEPPEEGSHDL